MSILTMTYVYLKYSVQKTGLPISTSCRMRDDFITGWLRGCTFHRVKPSSWSISLNRSVPETTLVLKLNINTVIQTRNTLTRYCCHHIIGLYDPNLEELSYKELLEIGSKRLIIPLVYNKIQWLEITGFLFECEHKRFVQL